MDGLKRSWFLMGVLLFFSLLLSSLSLRGWQGIDVARRNYISFVFPVEKALSFPLIKGRELFYFLRSHISLVKENAELKQELSLLKHELSLLKFSLGGEPFSREGFISCRIVYRFPDRWFSELVVNKGKNDGVEVGMAVLGEKGLVGEVVEVGAKISRVRLITSRNSIIGALVVSSRSFGVLRGTGSFYCELLYVPEERDVSVGDDVVTAGMGEKIPAGIAIGKVFKVSRKGDFMEVRVKPLEDFSKLRELWILKGR